MTNYTYGMCYRGKVDDVSMCKKGDLRDLGNQGGFVSRGIQRMKPDEDMGENFQKFGSPSKKDNM